jgi:hypothetical protein
MFRDLGTGNRWTEQWLFFTMKMIPTPRPGFAASSQMDLFPTETSTNEALRMSLLPTSGNTIKPIFSQESAAGLPRSALPDGRTIVQRGRGRAHVSPSAGSEEAWI